MHYSTIKAIFAVLFTKIIKMDKTELGSYLFQRIRVDVKSKGYNFDHLPKDYFLKRRTIYNLKNGIFSFSLLNKIEAHFGIKITFNIEDNFDTQEMLKQIETFTLKSEKLLKDMQENPQKYSKENFDKISRGMGTVMESLEDI